jgi:hypothetical protein
MEMTHYMELLATNQPWNLILFMAIPVILAETVAITELIILFRGNKNGKIGLINRIASIIGWLYFLWVFIFLSINVVVPLTTTWGWRGIIDIIAVGFYLLGVIPLMWMALIDMHIIARSSDERQKLKLHAIFVGIFLVVAHIAMIFGMLNPNLMSHKKWEDMTMKSESMQMEHKMEHTEPQKMQLKK